MKEHHVWGLSPVGFHRMVYSEWGDSDNPNVVICVHGLTRNRHSFNFLARVLSRHYRVICPDIVGRGSSDFLSQAELYNYPQYLADMSVLLARLNVNQVHWVGTSMGGIIGLMLASLPQNPIRTLVLNDIGHLIPAEGIQRIAEQTGILASFFSRQEAFDHLRKVFAKEYGDLSESIWEEVLSSAVRQDPGTKLWHRAYDPAIVIDLKKHLDSGLTDWDLMSYWKKVTCPCLVLRGEESDILTAPIAREMTSSKSKASVLTFPGFRHAPPLIEANQIEAIEKWLAEND